MVRKLVIVESPAKAKTIKKFLGKGYKIEASVGHIRDLPKSTLGIDIENDFEPKYITIRGKGEIVAKLRKEVKKADKIYLATDPDREGEAISWHLFETLNLNEETTSRITFNEITKSAVQKSIKEARKINMDLVNSQQARRELDRIVGYKISPLLWRKVKKGLSAGRVQSVTLKLICDRDEEIKNFQSEEYWSLDVDLKYKNSKFNAKLSRYGKDKIELKTREETEHIKSSIKNEKFYVDKIKVGTRIKKTVPPFTTSTLQQEASKLLGFATNKTMQIAQQLYEGVDIKGEGTVGLVSYIRTDSTRISDEAFEEVMTYIKDNFGEEYTVKTKNKYKSKNKAQEAHEAIRPTHVVFSADSIKESISKDQYKLYKLIWERFVASQMPDAVYDTLSIEIKAGTYVFKTNRSSINFEGFMIVYKKNIEKEEENKIPKLNINDELDLVKVNDMQHFTQPPARYTEAMLVKNMESLGIGRPSTYAATISNIVARRYVIKENKMFYTTELGEIVNDIMKNNFADIVDVDFTAKMEHDLDKIEDGELEWKEIMRKFYPSFEEKLIIADEKIGSIEVRDEITDIQCEKCGKYMLIKYGKYGKFMACQGFPECRSTKTFFEEAGVGCPKCSSKILIKKTKKGRKYFGCENNPECEFMSWDKPTGQLCVICSSHLIEKGTKDKKIVCSTQCCSFNSK